MTALSSATLSSLSVSVPTYDRDAASVGVVHFGFGPHEVAAGLGISYGNAKVVLHRARARLRAAVVQHEIVDPGDGS